MIISSTSTSHFLCNLKIILSISQYAYKFTHKREMKGESIPNN